ncbi:MAG TPA: STAS domain-containing protein [Acidobacteriaceae bacterium]|jgi:anti-sigma B factor antagonist|nr:STAS domain-containing protein [Acidobacteriaceae bacterium]
MSLNLVSRFCGSVYVIQCEGCIVWGEEEKSFDALLEHRAHEFTRVVLNFSKLTRMDSMGLGLLVRHAIRLRRRGGDIRLAAAPPFIAALLHLTKLTDLLQSFPTEEDAILSFLMQPSPHNTEQKRGLRVLAFDDSADLCSFVRSVLTQYGFDVTTTCSFRDARTLLRVNHADYILVGPGTPQLPSIEVLEELRTLAPKASPLRLDANFKSSDVLEATQTLLQIFGVSAAS